MSIFATIRSALSQTFIDAAEKEVLAKLREHADDIARPISSALESKGIDIQESDVKTVILAGLDHLETLL
jgi:hypothetical protein